MGKAGGLQRGMPVCGACGSRQDPAPSWQAEGPAAVMTALGRPPGAVGWRLASRTCRLCSGLPWSLSVTAAPLRLPHLPRRALTPGHVLNPPQRLMGHFPSCTGRGGAARRGALGSPCSSCPHAAQFPKPASCQALLHHTCGPVFSELLLSLRWGSSPWDPGPCAHSAGRCH